MMLISIFFVLDWSKIHLDILIPFVILENQKKHHKTNNDQVIDASFKVVECHKFLTTKYSDSVLDRANDVCFLVCHEVLDSPRTWQVLIALFNRFYHQ